MFEQFIPKEIRGELNVIFYEMHKDDPNLSLRVHHRVWTTVCLVWVMRELLQMRAARQQAREDADDAPTGIYEAIPVIEEAVQ